VADPTTPKEGTDPPKPPPRADVDMDWDPFDRVPWPGCMEVEDPDEA
jgi:hypothetical protein